MLRLVLASHWCLACPTFFSSSLIAREFREKPAWGISHLLLLRLVAKSCPTLCRLIGWRPPVNCSWDFPVKNTGVGCHFLLQGIFPTQGLNSHLLHCRRILYHWATRKAQILKHCSISSYRYLLLFSCSVLSNSLWLHELQHARLPCPSLLPSVCSESCPLSQRCHPTISSSVTPFSSCLQSFPASRSFPVSWLFASGGQNIGASTSAWVLPMNIQHWFPLGLTDLISLLSTGLSRVFPSTTVRRHQFFGAQPSL